MRQHPAVVNVRAPAHETVFVWLLPELRDEPAQQQMLREAHLRVRRHFKRAHLDETEPARAAFRRVKFINGKLGAMRVAAGINQQISEQPVHQPRRRLAELANLFVHFLERDIEFVKRIVARLVNARRLRRRADEQTAEQPAQRRMILPIGQQRAQQIGPAQHRRIRRRLAADDDVVAAAGAGVAAVHHEFFRAEPRQTRLLVKHRRALDEFVPRFARVHVHLDHAGVGRDGELVQARIARRRFAFDDDGQTRFRSAVVSMPAIRSR